MRISDWSSDVCSSDLNFPGEPDMPMVIDWSQSGESQAPPPPPITRAAQYVRMSTEHQKYSTDNQSAVIRRYAEERGYHIVRCYADEGKSGLSLDGRQALKELLADIENGRAAFSVVLRSEERSVGQEGVRRSRSRGA